LVEQAGNTVSDVVDSVKRVSDIVAEISSASQEQSEGIELGNLAITQSEFSNSTPVRWPYPSS